MAKAAVTRSIRDDHQKNFLKIFEGLTGKHSRWEIWRDFIHLTAIEISNSTDKLNAPERTKEYQTIISKYSAAERNGMAEMLAEVVMGMEQNPDQDFLGSLYMMCELGNNHSGQFFTPYDVCRCMAELTFDAKLVPDMEGFISVSDPACGAGAECGRDDHPQGRDDSRQKGKRMTPIPFREQNITYNPPEGMEDKCETLPAFRGEGQVISCWHLTLWERIKLLLTGRLWFSVIGNGQPPIWLGVDCPFIRK